MHRAAAVSLAAAVLGLAACGSDPPGLPAACLQDEASVARALRAAPGDVRLADGTLLSTCVTRARSDGQLASLGLLLTAVAEDLAMRARDERSPELARRVGFLAGAVQRGSDRTTGIQAELARRVARAAVKLDGSSAVVQRALIHGTRAGLARG